MNTIRIAALLVCAAAIGTPLALHAQSQSVAQSASSPSATWSGAHHRHNPLLKALEGLNLTPQQRTQIQGYVAAAKQADAGADATPDQHRADRQKLRAEIMGVLTPAQQAQLTATLKAQRKEHQESAPTPGT
jgi:Spy/CpxP family protein refolding chaperone